jgi:putative endopeptidase
MKRTSKKYRNTMTRKILKGGQKIRSTAKHHSTKIKHKHTAKQRCFTDTQLKLYCKKPLHKFVSFEDDYVKTSAYKVQQKHSNVENYLKKMFTKPYSPITLRIQDDFYDHVNYTWLKHNKLNVEERYIVQVDNFRITQYKVYKELIEITENYLKKNHSKEANRIRALYQSARKLVSLPQCLKYTKQYVDMMNTMMQDKANLWQFLGTINRNEIYAWGSPFVFSLAGDSKNADTYRCYVQPPKLTLTDLTIYFDDGNDVKYKENFKKRYFKYINDLFTIFFGKNHGFKSIDIFNVESKILNAMGCEGEKENPEYYNRITPDEAQKKYNFNWNEFSKSMGFKQTPKFFITGSVNYLKCCSDMLLADWTSTEWRTYFIYIFIRQIARWSWEPRKVYYKFNDEFVEGERSDMPRYLLPVFAMALAYNTFLTNQYIDTYNIEENERYVEAMAHDLKAVFIRRIKRNKWLAPKTKAHALRKLDKIKMIIGTPKVMRADPVINYNPNDLWENIVKCTSWNFDYLIRLEGKPLTDIPVIDWFETPPKFISKQAYVVNAYYNPTENSIFIPSAYMQAPFVDLNERGMEYNLAFIGFTICHEMAHCLDNVGSQYDEHGNLKDWWSPRDKIKYKKKEANILKHYETFAGYDKIKFDVEGTLGEDIADITALAVCEEYLRDFQEVQQDIIPVRMLSFRAFFFYFAMQMRQQLSKKAMKNQLKKNPHPIDKYRVNVPLSRLALFKQIHNITKKDKMYWEDTEHIW